MRVGIFPCPAQTRLAIERHEARDTVVGGAVDEHFPAARGVHRVDELTQIAALRRVEVHRDVVILESEAGRGVRFVRQAIARIQQPEIDHDLEAGIGQLAQLRF